MRSEEARSKEPITNRSEETPFAGSMVINPKGARIERLALNETLVLKSVTRGDGRNASSHPCTPNFGPETSTSYGLPQHGQMRNELCFVEESGPSLVILNHEIKAGSYPAGMHVRQIFSLFGQSFTLETTHSNNGEVPAPVNFGEHLYWAAPNGWRGLTINGEDVTEAVEKDLVIPLRAENQIVIPGLPGITLEQQGLPFANLWVYHDESSGRYDQYYVCIEPIEGDPNQDFFGSPDSMISPGASRVTVINIKPSV